VPPITSEVFMHHLYRLFLCLIGILCGLATSALAVELIYPADKTIVGRSDFLILKGGAQPPLDAMTIVINGVASDPLDISTPEYRAAFGDFLILEPEWKKGTNTIDVKGLRGGKEVASSKAEFYYSNVADPSAIMPPGFTPFILHTPAKEALCAPCHNMKPTAAELKGTTEKSNPCASCHKRMFVAKYVHGPEGIFQCSDCHDSNSKPQRWQVTKAELNLCGECHVDKIDDIKKNPFVHGPVAVGNCTICHDPHAADQPAQLVSPINTLCLSCHGNVANSLHVTRGVGGNKHPLDKVGDPLRPGSKLSCASCHNPHGGATRSFLRGRVTNPIALCQLCHKK
jgi:predicted CXXCH cytochrome family protein